MSEEDEMNCGHSDEDANVCVDAETDAGGRIGSLWRRDLGPKVHE